jgi:hypothetical protein
MHKSTAHAQEHSTYTRAQHVHKSTAHTQEHSTYTRAQHMHKSTAHAQEHSTVVVHADENIPRDFRLEEETWWLGSKCIESDRCKSVFVWTLQWID